MPGGTRSACAVLESEGQRHLPLLVTGESPLAASATCTPKSNAPTAVEQPRCRSAWLPGRARPGPLARTRATAAQAVISQLGDGPAGCGDLLPGPRRERVRAHPQPAGPLA